MNNNLNINSTSPLLKCSNITLGYGSKNIVNNFNYTIHSGDYLSIIGRNGCGKTTFLRGLAGVLHPRAGKIELSSGLKRNQIGYLPQITVTQKDFPASVEEIVLSAFQGKSLLLPFYGKALRKRADECLEMTHATNLRKESFRELSGGQKQRVLLARALCAAERLLLLDEPVTGLDPESSQNMYNIIKDLHENKNMTIVMVTHDIDAARNNSTRILNFNEIAQ
ncbi:ATP-binding cassette domain-containing protein [uncultured Fibrobacter sp.]|uniref:metal ABC transporter ATP-binding protein n=1 Tax=uncultured Fibrobacter sp. TaxID=261512 RepID=UPI0025D8BF96|nr:ATP-binding cassette domain-containing protein [uncultured Fibrobacter sp.]